MGLDLVSIVYAIEEEFEIEIPSSIAEHITTPRMVIEYLMSLQEVGGKWSRGYVEECVWQIIENEGGIQREDFTPDSRFIEDMGLS